MAEKVFIEGMTVRDPHPKAPEWVKAAISFNVGKFIEFADHHQKNGWLNVDLNLSDKGVMYVSLNQFTPKPKDAGEPAEEVPIIKLDEEPETDIPF